MRLLGALLIALCLPGCGDPGPDSVIGACDNRTQGSSSLQGLCRVWTGKETGDFKTYCASQGGAYTEGGSCPAEGLLGTCFTDQLFGLYLTYYYYAPTFDLASAKSHCQTKGSGTSTFTPR